MDKQAINLAKRMQLEESMEFERKIFKDDVILYNELTSDLSALKEQVLILAVKINKQKDALKSYEMDIELLNKVNKQIDLEQDRHFFPEEK